ncbi:putative sphingolipid delta(4)-desaturase/C4-hydroxylase, partial [Trichinella patagoniensis]
LNSKLKKSFLILFFKMGAKVSRNDYDWSYTEEPHATRRNLILKKHPEIAALFGFDHAFVYVVTCIVITQFIFCYLLKDSDWTLIFLQAYFSGGLYNHALMLAVHEIAHNAAFGNCKPLWNRLFGIFANFPIPLPFSVSFKKYHIEHHRYMGEEVLDTDVPTLFEARLFTNSFRKLIWLFFQPFFYAFRPLVIYRKAVSDLEILNFIVQMTVNYFVIQYFGWKSFTFLILSMILSMGIHPTAGHFISEHYVFKPGQETYSYYGPLNLVTFNVGYHVEHHDFPFIPGVRLPLVRKIAPEYYDHLMHHESWIWVLWKFVFDPAIGPYARIKRPARVPLDHSATNYFTDYVAILKRIAKWFRLAVYPSCPVPTEVH